MNKYLKPFNNNATALSLGAMLTLSFAPRHISQLAIIAPACLLYLWHGASAKRALWLGFLFGLGFFGTGVYWIYISIHYFGEMNAFAAFLITSLFIMGLALFPASVGYVLNRFFTRPLTKNLCAFPALWVVSEWIRSWLFTGFPWLFLGYTQLRTPLKGYAPLLSVYGVSLAILLISGLLVNLALRWRGKINITPSYHLLAIALIWVIGGELSFQSWTEVQGQSIPVSLVQGNIPQSIKWSPAYLSLSFERYDQLTAPLWKNQNNKENQTNASSRLIIWPETAIPASLQDAAPFLDEMDEKARANHATLILGLPIQVPGKNSYYNAIISRGQDKKIYLKRHLVPFGEYVPFANQLSGVLDKLGIPVSLVEPGKAQQAPMILHGIKLLPTICYEIAFPSLVNTSDQTIGLLITLTNDAWYGHSSAQAQHLQMAAMRALELGRPLLFASNDGITAIIGPTGQIQAAAPPFKTYVLQGTVQPMTGLTPWMKYGMLPLMFILFGLLTLAHFTELKLTIFEFKTTS